MLANYYDKINASFVDEDEARLLATACATGCEPAIKALFDNRLNCRPGMPVINEDLTAV